MNLKNPDLFRSWLIRQLEPICKANPEPVSKYVCALLKKEKTDAELRQSLVSQLDIFLDSATEEFATFLIDVLKDEKYLTDNAHFRPAALSSKSEPEDNVELKIEAAEMEATTLDKEEERRSPSPIQAPTPSPPRKTPSPPRKTTFQKSFSPRSRRPRLRNERRRIVPRRGRRDNNSSHSDSPPMERRQTIRKRSASGSSESSTKSPRRSWIASRPSDAKKYKHGSRYSSRPSPPGARSRSTSPKLRKRRPANGSFRKRLPANTRSRSLSDDEHNHNPLKRVTPYPNDLSTMDMPPHVKADLPPSVIDQPPPYGQKKERCVDFESKGYCARGDMCPFDHGPSPIVLDNNLLNGIVPMPPPVHGPNFSVHDPISYTPQFVNATFPTAKSPYRHDNHSQQPQQQQQLLQPQIPHNRELIPVPTVGPLPHKSKKLAATAAGKPSYGHIFSSLPPGVSQTSIELTNVPAELNNIPDLYDKFSTFGSITLIQAKRNSDPSVALLTFSNATEAALAFINADTAMPRTKAAWYADQCIMKPFPRKSIPASGGGGPLNAKGAYVINRKLPTATPSHPPNTAATGVNTPSPAAGDETKCNAATTPVAAAATATATTSAVKTEPNSAEKSVDAADKNVKNDVVDKANEKMRQDPGRLLSDLIKKKRELLERQLASRKEIVEKMKWLEAGGEKEKTWQEMLRKLNDVIAENENSIKVSLQQRKEYLQKMNIVPMDSTALNNLKMEKSYEPSSLSSAAADAASIATNATNAVATADRSETPNRAASSDNRIQSTSQLLDASGLLNENLFDSVDFSSVLDQEMEDDEDEDEDDVEGNDDEELESAPSTTRNAATASNSNENVAANAVTASVANKCSSSSQNASPAAAPAPTPEYTRLVVSGFENGDEDDLLQHFTRFGNILDKEFDNTIPSATLIYDNRKSAEDAKKEGRNFQDRLLSVNVYSSKKFQPLVRRVGAAASPMAAAAAAYKQQHENDYNSYVPYPGGGNPYKYKNPQMSVTPSIVAEQRQAPTSYRSVYTYRAEQRAARVVNVKAAANTTNANNINTSVNVSLQSTKKADETTRSKAAKSTTKQLISDDDDDDEVSASISRLDSGGGGGCDDDDDDNENENDEDDDIEDFF